jgi:hypothetical protein
MKKQPKEIKDIKFISFFILPSLVHQKICFSISPSDWLILICHFKKVEDNNIFFKKRLRRKCIQKKKEEKRKC